MALNVEEMSAKICESCGESFGCGAELDSCWCFAIELSAENSAYLKTNYTNCVCPKCLAAPPSTEKDPPLV